MRIIIATLTALAVSTITAQAVCPTSLTGSYVGSAKTYNFGDSTKQVESIAFSTLSLTFTTLSYNRTNGIVVGRITVIQNNYRSRETGSEGAGEGVTTPSRVIPYYYNARTCQGFINLEGGPGVSSSDISLDDNGYSFVISNSGAQISGNLYKVRPDRNDTPNDTSDDVLEPNLNIEFSASKS